MNDQARVLVVDDDARSRATVEALLAGDGYAMEFSAGGAEAIERLGGKEVDLVVSDLMMPRVDGLEVCRQVKAHPRWRFVPVILLTALDGQDDMIRGLEAGADEFLSKPIDRVVLRAKVRAMLRVRRQYAQLRDSAADLDAMLLRRREEVASRASLTERERQVLDLLLLGRSHDDIGRELGISERTSKFHQTNVLNKLGADSRLDLLRLFL